MFDFEEMLKEQAEKMGLADSEPVEADLPDLEELSRSLFAMQERMGKYLELSGEELAELPDEELFEVIYTRIAEKDELNYCQQVFAVVSEYDAEMQNGGLCQYFLNSVNAAMLAEALEVIHADAHSAHFCRFVSENGIDAAAFVPEDGGDWETEYAAIAEKYPFDAYDEAFYALPGLTEPLLAFVRMHLEQF